MRDQFPEIATYSEFPTWRVTAHRLPLIAILTLTLEMNKLRLQTRNLRPQRRDLFLQRRHSDALARRRLLRWFRSRQRGRTAQLFPIILYKKNNAFF